MASEEPIVHSKSHLKCSMTRQVHEWNIESFEQRFSLVKVNKPSTFIRSGPFTVYDGEKEHIFHMYVGKSGDEEGTDAGKICMLMFSKGLVTMTLQFSFCDPPKNDKWVEKNPVIFSSEKNSRLISKIVADITNWALPNGTLTLIAHMKILRWISQDLEDSLPTPSDRGLVIERTGLENLSDFTLICGDSKIKAHKVVLASNCSYFEAMFRHNCVESQNDKVTVVDLDLPTLNMMIEMMYTRQPDNLPSEEDLLLKLLQASDKYGFEFMSNCVERKLIKDFLDVGRSAHLLKSALRFNAPFLQAKAKKLLLANMGVVSTSVEFAQLVKDFPDCLLS